MADGDETVSVIGFGDICIIKYPKLNKISFTTEFPSTYRPYLSVSEIELLTPEIYIDYLTKWKTSRSPIRFVFAGSTHSVNMPATIASMKFTEKWGDVGTWIVDLTFQKYVFFSTNKVSNNQSTEKSSSLTISTTRDSENIVPDTYVTKAGDTLWSVAKQFFGDGSKAIDIARINGIIDLSALVAGTILSLKI
jgi:nucleoid-associated protein YgaU